VPWFVSSPDLSYAIILVSQYMANLDKKIDLEVSGFSGIFVAHSLKFCKTDERLIGYVDLDFAINLNKSRSHKGYELTVDGCVVSWKEMVQPIIV
jgi:hypothetical protein